ncbi:Uncharacterised protein [Chlamydia trachomatis]|nr:Uncharacterised protein [Chlamydia trachomatis]
MSQDKTQSHHETRLENPSTLVFLLTNPAWCVLVRSCYGEARLNASPYFCPSLQAGAYPNPYDQQYHEDGDVVHLNRLQTSLSVQAKLYTIPATFEPLVF